MASLSVLDSARHTAAVRQEIDGSLVRVWKGILIARKITNGQVCRGRQRECLAWNKRTKGSGLSCLPLESQVNRAGGIVRE